VTTLSPQGRGTARASAQGEGRAKNGGDLLARARAARREMTDAEERLWARLRDRRLGGFKFRRQHVFGRTRPDFVCIAAHLIVEVDGSQHVEGASADASRTIFLSGRGFRVLRVWNNDVLFRMGAVLEAILYELTAPHPGALSRACPSPASGRG
jgi:very-short-patch-repair endonuclease